MFTAVQLDYLLEDIIHGLYQCHLKFLEQGVMLGSSFEKRWYGWRLGELYFQLLAFSRKGRKVMRLMGYVICSGKVFRIARSCYSHFNVWDAINRRTLPSPVTKGSNKYLVTYLGGDRLAG